MAWLPHDAIEQAPQQAFPNLGPSPEDWGARAEQNRPLRLLFDPDIPGGMNEFLRNQRNRDQEWVQPRQDQIGDRDIFHNQDLQEPDEILIDQSNRAQGWIDAYITERRNSQAFSDNFYLRQRQVLWDMRARRLLGGPPVTSMSLPEATRWLQSLVQLAADIPRLGPWNEYRTVSEEVEAILRDLQ